MKNLILIAAAAGSMAAVSAPAQAAEFPGAPAPVFAEYTPKPLAFNTIAAFDDDDDDDWRERRRWRDRDRDWDDRRWRGGRGDYWRGRDGRWRCRRNDGTTGLLVGAVGGALLGRTIDTRGDRSLGTILGAVGGGLLGREIDRGGVRCR